MVLIYPMGVPLLFFVMLYLQRDKIIRVMLVQKALEDGGVPEYDDTMSEEEKSTQERSSKSCARTARKSKTSRSKRSRRPTAIGAETDRRKSPRVDSSTNASDRRKNLMQLTSQFESARVLKNEKTLVISPLLLAMQQYFEKYEGRMYW